MIFKILNAVTPILLRGRERDPGMGRSLHADEPVQLLVCAAGIQPQSFNSCNYCLQLLSHKESRVKWL